MQVFNGQEYHRYKGMRYFTRGCKKLHREVWKHHYGDIPKGYHVHHIDENTANNDISNLELLSGSEHLHLHMQERMQNPAFIQELRARMDYAREAANNWHRSEDGREWHKKQAKKTLCKIQPKRYVCEHCGKEFIAKPNGHNRFCSNACKTAWRVKSGLDNETRKCIVCGNEFITNKYYPKRTCCRMCANILLSQSKKKKSL